MTKFFFADPPRSTRTEISLEAFLDLTIGSSLRSAASSDEFFEYGTSDEMNIRIEADKKSELLITCFFTLNEDEIAPLRINIFDSGEPLTASMLEKKIFSLRQVYAFNYLARNDILEYAFENIAAKHYDIEEMLIPAEEQLIVSAAAAGSFWLTILPKSKQMFLNAVGAAVALYPRGREALLKRVELTTDLRQLEVERQTQANKVEAAKGIIDVAREIEKIKTPEVRDALQREYLRNLQVADANTPKVLAKEPSRAANAPKISRHKPKAPPRLKLRP